MIVKSSILNVKSSLDDRSEDAVSDFLLDWQLLIKLLLECIRLSTSGSRGHLRANPDIMLLLSVCES